MPNPTDAVRGGSATARSESLLATAGDAANTKMSWSEWFGVSSNNWIFKGYGADKVLGPVSGAVQDYAAAKVAANALVTALSGITGFWMVSAAGTVALDLVAKRLEDLAKEYVPPAISAVQSAYGRFFFGSGTPQVILTPRVQTEQDGKRTMAETMDRIKSNSALLQDLLNRLAGAAGKPYYCDDVYGIGLLSQKCITTKGELERDIVTLTSFLQRLRTDLANIDPANINTQVKNLAKAICEANDGRHWDNTWTTATVMRALRCSKEHCHGPR
jgi:hypothetical protein